jgi:hypothetical protein
MAQLASASYGTALVLEDASIQVFGALEMDDHTRTSVLPSCLPVALDTFLDDGLCFSLILHSFNQGHLAFNLSPAISYSDRNLHQQYLPV